MNLDDTFQNRFRTPDLSLVCLPNYCGDTLTSTFFLSSASSQDKIMQAQHLLEKPSEIIAGIHPPLYSAWNEHVHLVEKLHLWIQAEPIYIVCLLFSEGVFTLGRN